MKKVKDGCVKVFIKIITFIGCNVVKKKNIILLANGLKTYDGNTKYIYEYLKNNKNYVKNFEYYWVTSNIKEYRRLKEVENNVIFSYSIEGLIKIIQSKIYIVTIGINDIIDGLYNSKKSIIIQTWHGIPIKTLGLLANKYYSKNDINKQINRCFPENAYVLSSSSYIESIFSKCFKVAPEKFLKFGYPRNDIFIDVNNIYNKKKLLGDDIEKKILLYCPTWRENSQFILFPFDDGNLSEFNEYLKESNQMLFIKLHPLHEKEGFINQRLSNIKIFDNNRSIDTQELLQITDVLITDYSSIYFDFILMDKPVIFIPYDLEQYRKSRDFLYDYEKNTPGPKIESYETLKKVLDKLNKEYYKKERDAMNIKFNRYNAFNSSKQLIKFIEDKLSE